MSTTGIPLRRRAARFGRKHAVALLGLGVFHLLFFFPTLFMGRILSPDDIYYNYDPWRTIATVEPQNPLLNDPATAYGTLMSLLRGDGDAFHWNRYVASGIPGTGSAAAAVLSPFVAFPALLLPTLAVWSGIILLKVNIAFVFTYLWLRMERSGRRAAAVGAMVFAVSGVYAVWWLWQGTNATALYPAVLYVVASLFRGRRIAFATTALIVAALLLSGFPATIVYVAWTAIGYAIFLAVVRRSLPVREILKALAATAVAVVATMPFLVPFVQLLRRSGYLESRAGVAAGYTFPLQHLHAFVDPFVHGNPTAHLWVPGPELSRSANFVETTLYLGIAALVLAAVALLRRRDIVRWYWLAVVAVTGAAIFGATPVGAIVSKLPGIGYSPLTRLRVLLPVGAAYLAAAGAAWLIARGRAPRHRRWIASTIIIVAAVELALFAASFHPYVRPDVARLPESATVHWLREQPRPFRIAPMFDFLWPNTAELVRLEDIRSHFGSEKRYREILQRIDSGSWGGSGTVLQFNSLRMDLGDPLLSMLNTRYLVEQPSIDIVRWKIYEATEPTGGDQGAFVLRPATPVRATVTFDERKTWAIDVSVAVRSDALEGDLTARLIRPELGRATWSRRWSRQELSRFDKIYIPVPRDVEPGHAVVIELETRGISVALPRDPSTSAAFTLGLVRSPLVHVATFDDGRIFENLACVPRFNAVWDVREMPFDAMLRDRGIDYARTAIVESRQPRTETILAVPPVKRRARIAIAEYGATRSEVIARSDAPFLLVSSEKLTPELRVSVDGTTTDPVPVNGLFAAVPLASGEHRVVFERRVGRGWYVPATVAWLVIAGSTFAPRLRRLTRRRVGAPPE